MPGTTLPPDQSRSLSGLHARVERIERKTAPSTTGARPERMVFSYAGALAANTESPPWYPSRGGSIIGVRLALRTAATGTNTVEVHVNGSTIQSFTLSSGLTIFTATAIEVTPLSYVTVKTTAVGASDGDLTVTLDLA